MFFSCRVGECCFLSVTRKAPALVSTHRHTLLLFIWISDDKESRSQTKYPERICSLLESESDEEMEGSSEDQEEEREEDRGQEEEEEVDDEEEEDNEEEEEDNEEERDNEEEEEEGLAEEEEGDDEEEDVEEEKEGNEEERQPLDPAFEAAVLPVSCGSVTGALYKIRFAGR